MLEVCLGLVQGLLATGQGLPSRLQLQVHLVECLLQTPVRLLQLQVRLDQLSPILFTLLLQINKVLFSTSSLLKQLLTLRFASSQPLLKVLVLRLKGMLLLTELRDLVVFDTRSLLAILPLLFALELQL
jgi:hypothetical protein